jgi:hypothetical protein
MYSAKQPERSNGIPTWTTKLADDVAASAAETAD